jgi:short-subunit dehydrogenase
LVHHYFGTGTTQSQFSKNKKKAAESSLTDIKFREFQMKKYIVTEIKTTDRELFLCTAISTETLFLHYSPA